MRILNVNKETFLNFGLEKLKISVVFDSSEDVKTQLIDFIERVFLDQSISLDRTKIGVKIKHKNLENFSVPYRTYLIESEIADCVIGQFNKIAQSNKTLLCLDDSASEIEISVINLT